MGDAYVFDAVRTPRGRGRSSGSLHEVSPLRLAAGVLKNIRDRNDLDTSLVDDVILGVADPVNEQGAPGCVMVNVLPATVSVPVREVVFGFAATL